MFNKERKERFLKEKVLNGYGHEVWFKRIGVIEEEKGKDVIDFEKEEFLEFLMSTKISSWKYLKQIVYIFRSYGKWCIENNISDKNMFEELTPIEIKNCLYEKNIKQSVVTRTQICNWIDDLVIKNARDQFAFMCLFEGIKGYNYEEIVDLTIDDLITIDDKFYFRVNRKRNDTQRYELLEVSKYLYDLAVEAYKTPYYLTLGVKPKRFYLTPSHKVFKEFYNTSDEADVWQKGQAVYRALYRNLKIITDRRVFEKTIKPTDILFSGILHAIKEGAQMNNMPVSLYIRSEKIKLIEERFNTTIEAADYEYRYYDHLDID